MDQCTSGDTFNVRNLNSVPARTAPLRVVWAGSKLMLAECSHCGGLARVVRNPFYGTGLAVHKTIIDCDECRHIRLMNARHETRTEPVAIPTTKRRLLKRMKPVHTRTR